MEQICECKSCHWGWDRSKQTDNREKPSSFALVDGDVSRASFSIQEQNVKRPKVWGDVAWKRLNVTSSCGRNDSRWINMVKNLRNITNGIKPEARSPPSMARDIKGYFGRDDILRLKKVENDF